MHDLRTDRWYAVKVAQREGVRKRWAHESILPPGMVTKFWQRNGCPEDPDLKCPRAPGDGVLGTRVARFHGAWRQLVANKLQTLPARDHIALCEDLCSALQHTNEKDCIVDNSLTFRERERCAALLARICRYRR